MEAGFVVAMVVGLMEVAPGVCQMELLNPDGTINTSRVQCEMIARELHSFAAHCHLSSVTHPSIYTGRTRKAAFLMRTYVKGP